MIRILSAIALAAIIASTGSAKAGQVLTKTIPFNFQGTGEYNKLFSVSHLNLGGARVIASEAIINGTASGSAEIYSQRGCIPYGCLVNTGPYENRHLSQGGGVSLTFGYFNSLQANVGQSYTVSGDEARTIPYTGTLYARGWANPTWLAGDSGFYASGAYYAAGQPYEWCGYSEWCVGGAGTVSGSITLRLEIASGFDPAVILAAHDAGWASAAGVVIEGSVSDALSMESTQTYGFSSVEGEERALENLLKSAKDQSDRLSQAKEDAALAAPAAGVVGGAYGEALAKGAEGRLEEGASIFQRLFEMGGGNDSEQRIFAGPMNVNFSVNALTPTNFGTAFGSEYTDIDVAFSLFDAGLSNLSEYADLLASMKDAYSRQDQSAYRAYMDQAEWVLGRSEEAFSMSETLFARMASSSLPAVQYDGQSTFTDSSALLSSLSGFTHQSRLSSLLLGASAVAVPEPRTWLMLFCGFFLVGAISRHSRSKSYAGVPTSR